MVLRLTTGICFAFSHLNTGNDASSIDIGEAATDACECVSGAITEIGGTDICGELLCERFKQPIDERNWRQYDRFHIDAAYA